MNTINRQKQASHVMWMYGPKISKIDRRRYTKPKSITTNNHPTTVLAAFCMAIEEYSLPLRVRTDKGGENILVSRYMVENRGTQRGNCA